jgi:hypothetical protein
MTASGVRETFVKCARLILLGLKMLLILVSHDLGKFMPLDKYSQTQDTSTAKVYNVQDSEIFFLVVL